MRYYVGVILGILITKIVPGLEYALLIILLALLMILFELIMFAKCVEDEK